MVIATGHDSHSQWDSAFQMFPVLGILFLVDVFCPFSWPVIYVLQDPNPFLGPSTEPDALLRSAVPPLPNKEQGRLGTSVRSLAPLHFPSELLPFDEALRDVCTIRPLMEGDVVARHGGQLLDIKAAERRG